ncbi:Gfo/Idh/MocA family oxidoreductase [Streptomyces flavofungini]|uniref:Gfo/Idh/MocA family oxidoreductase n=1 Tax=Streptomyces flavofungini TaxID=68200 RepID=A0ABS0XEY4_9ACTN|nr:Gfo/Idh/MocA family oxidoreductase [Streptomyces flavofungini]MBJ3811767.1 Gfo/Idh/MocA family oxidoreductase [Streptomyces flavofungini]
MSARTHVCIVGYGVAGQLHHRLLGGLGVRVSVVDPAAARLAPSLPAYARIEDVPRHPPVDVWSVCTPTAAHVETAAAVLDRDPSARLLVEKPVCRSWEAPDLSALLAKYDESRLVVMDQYAHATAPDILRAAREEWAPGHPIDAVRVAFGKDRRADIASGRFVDRDYGVFGYEWLHMLALLGTVLPPAVHDRYLATDPGCHDLGVAHEPELTSVAAHDRTRPPGGPAVELYSTIVGPHAGPGCPAPAWYPRTATGAESRQRLVRVDAGPVSFRLDLDPVGLPGGTPLPRNTHRLTMRRAEGAREWLIHDSPMENALRWALSTLFAPGPRSAPDLRGIARISRLADRARAQEQLPVGAPSPVLRTPTVEVNPS